MFDDALVDFAVGSLALMHFSIGGSGGYTYPLPPCRWLGNAATRKIHSAMRSRRSAFKNPELYVLA